MVYPKTRGFFSIPVSEVHSRAIARKGVAEIASDFTRPSPIFHMKKIYEKNVNFWVPEKSEHFLVFLFLRFVQERLRESVT